MATFEMLGTQNSLCLWIQVVVAPEDLFKNVPFTDASPLQNPLVGRIDGFLEIGVGKDPGRRVATKGSDFRSKRAQFP